MIEDTAIEEGESANSLTWPKRFRIAGFWLLLAILAWAPFPLGSNREWSWSILTILVSACWVLWCGWAITNLPRQSANIRRLAVPAALVTVTMGWVLLQMTPAVPASWVHPVWPLAAGLLQHPVAGVVSLNPWRTGSEASKLFTELAIAWLSFSFARNDARVRVLLNTIIFVGAGYAAYGFVLGIIGTSQYALYYPEPRIPILPSGPFVLHNSFATYEGLVSLAAIARLVEKGQRAILANKGLRRWALTTLQFAFGSGAPYLIAVALSISALISSASRAGAFATFCGLCAMGIVGIALAKRGTRMRWMLLSAAGIVLPLLALFWISGGMLSSRTEDLLDAGSGDAIRTALRLAAERMIASAPLLGLGLGTFEDAYPMYASQMFPYVMDAAHCDYLEFAAGVGLPAAICWWGAMLWAVITMLRGIFIRRRDRIYALVGLGATVLVGVHSAVDFSLQIPAVALSYACLLGLGLAQSYSSR